MKAGDAAYYCAVKTLKEQGVKLRGDVLLTYVIGELQGGAGSVISNFPSEKIMDVINRARISPRFAKKCHFEKSDFYGAPRLIRSKAAWYISLVSP
jgi:hypothetical protein